MTLFERVLPAEAVAERPLPKLVASHGFVVTRSMDFDFDVSTADIIWVQNNINWFPKLRRRLLAAPPSKRPFVIMWHTEPLPLPSAAGLPRRRRSLRETVKIVLRDERATDMDTNYRRIREVVGHGIPDLLVVSSGSRKAFLAEHGIESHFVPMGYHPGIGRDLGINRDIDTLFVGAPDDPGHKRAVRQLRRNGVKLLATGGWSERKGIWGDERTRLINRTKIFLNLQRNPGKLSGYRMLLGMANRSLMMSEPIYDPAPYVPGTHYASVSLSDMPDAIRHYLHNDSERQRIADEGHSFATTELTMERSVAAIIQLCRQSTTFPGMEKH